MISIFKKPSNAALASRLQEILLKRRSVRWTDYVYSMSQLYHMPQPTMEEAFNKGIYEPYNRQFFLIQSTLTELQKPGDNYGYVLEPLTKKVFLLIPRTPLNLVNVDVANSKAAATIQAIISQKSEPIREASWQEMDNILDAFYENGLESATIPEFLDYKKSIVSHIDGGKFHSPGHAPNAYAFKRHVLNCVAEQLKTDKNFFPEHASQATDVKNLLHTSWFAHAKEDFSWEPLGAYFGLTHEAEMVDRRTEILAVNNKLAYYAILVEEKLKKGESIKQELDALKKILDNTQNQRGIEMDSIGWKFFVALCRIVQAPVVFLIGLLWLIPAHCCNLPYFGRAAFFWDTLCLFCDSLITIIRCLLFPLALIHAYNTSGSMNILEGECLRIVKTLIANTETESIFTQDLTTQSTFG